MSDSEIKTLERKINGDLRKAQSNMFSGKNEDAWVVIKEVWTDIEKIRSLDPNYRSLSMLEQNCQKQEEAIAKKLGKTVESSSRVSTPPVTRVEPTKQSAPAKDAGLSSSVQKRLEEIEKSLSQVEEILGSMKSESDVNKAKRTLDLASRKYGEIERMYKDSVGHPDVVASQKNIESLSGKLDAAASNILPVAVESRLMSMDRSLSEAEGYLGSVQKGSDVEKVQYQINQAKSTYEEIERMYQSSLGHSDVVAVVNKLKDVQSKLDAAAKKVAANEAEAGAVEAQHEALTQEWIEKTRPYLIGSGVSEKQLERSRIRGKEQILAQKALLEEVKGVYDAFTSVSWPLEKKWEIEKAETDLLDMLNGGQETLEQSIQAVIDEAVACVDGKLALLRADSSWKSDESVRPRWVTNVDRLEIKERMDAVEELMPEVIQKSHSGYVGLEAKLKELEAENQSRLAVLPKRTFMVLEKYSGDDADVLRAKAGDLVKAEASDAVIVKVHLIREDWRVEDVVEYTDTSRTAVQHRITYHMPAQVAAKTGGKILLFNAHIAKNKLSDGSFGGLTGNLEEYPHEIAAENIPN